MDEMGYVAHNLGEKDIEIGLPLISYLSQTYKVKFLSSNIEFVDPLPFGTESAPYKRVFRCCTTL